MNRYFENGYCWFNPTGSLQRAACTVQSVSRMLLFIDIESSDGVDGYFFVVENQPSVIYFLDSSKSHPTPRVRSVAFRV